MADKVQTESVPGLGDYKQITLNVLFNFPCPFYFEVNEILDKYDLDIKYTSEDHENLKLLWTNMFNDKIVDGIAIDCYRRGGVELIQKLFNTIMFVYKYVTRHEIDNRNIKIAKVMIKVYLKDKWTF